MHQVMVFIGNGFDIAVLKKYGRGITTSYDSFYAFFKYEYPDRQDNLLVQQMERAKSVGRVDWSDFEKILGEMLRSFSGTNEELMRKLDRDLNEIQQVFSQFLNNVIDNAVISNISKANDIIVKKIGKINCAQAMANGAFLRDLSKCQYETMRFHNGFNKNELLKYVFINFNYTSLLDNYMCLNKELFDPKPFSTSRNNTILDLNPYKYRHHNYPDPYVQLLPIDIFHPHGIQDVPKSLLFGIENETYCKNRDFRRTFVKSLWAQCAVRYQNKFAETELFIIYGCSIGESDSWWWQRIYERLISENPAELIIYNYGCDDENMIKEKFLNNCCLKEYDPYKLQQARANIYVVNCGPQAGKEAQFMSLPSLYT